MSNKQQISELKMERLRYKTINSFVQPFVNSMQSQQDRLLSKGGSISVMDAITDVIDSISALQQQCNSEIALIDVRIQELEDEVEEVSTDEV